MSDGVRQPTKVWAVAAAYTVITTVVTWPLTRGLTRDVASDLGDSLYYMWAIAWDCMQLVGILGGDLARIPTFFNANIFHPEPLGLVYSDHMIAQAIQVLPLYALSGNLILCYNVLILSTFVLCGLGTYLFVRELTGSARAAFVAGLLFAFAPYRMSQLPALNLLSVQWIPLALYGVRRYFDTGRRLPLAGAGAALVLQHLSSGYYLLYFTPFVAAYALWEIVARRAWRVRRIWVDLATLAVIVAAATAPFLVPYLLLTDRLPALRGPDEIARYSADVYAYLTAPQDLTFWGDRLRIYPRPEGHLFPGLLPVALAIAGIVTWAGRSVAAASGTVSSRRREWAARLFLTAGLVYTTLAAAAIFERRLLIELGPVTVNANDVTRLLAFAAAALVIVLILSRRARSIAAASARAPEGWAVALLVAAWWLSLGPRPTSFGAALDIAAPYAFLLEQIPGFTGTRVPARYAIVVAFALAVLAGFGLRAVERRRWGTIALIMAAVAFLAAVNVYPFPVNRVAPLSNLSPLERRIYPPAETPRVYAAVRRLPRDVVLVEFPFGQPDHDRRAMYYSTTHWRPLINGYSGFYPPGYVTLVALLTDVQRRPERAWNALRERGATHALVHEAAYPGRGGVQVSEWLRASGAEEIFRDGRDALFALPSNASRR